MSPPAIRLVDVTKAYPGADQPAVDRLTLDVPAGELVVFVGPSGCGKTTTLRLINRLEDPTTGTVEVNGRDVTTQAPHDLRRGIGYVIQGIGLFPHRTIAENIATVPRLLGWDRTRIGRRVDELADTMRLDRTMLGRYPTELSGGQQQRVGVARALAADPPILLMDEPYSAVDPVVRGELRAELKDLHQRLGTTIVLVTHDIDEALELGDRIAVFRTGGVVEQYAPPTEILARPATGSVADFLGEDRTLRRLALLPVTSAELEAVEPGRIVTSEAATLPTTATLRNAVDAFLTVAGDELLVVDSEGRAVGVLTRAAVAKQAAP